VDFLELDNHKNKVETMTIQDLKRMVMEQHGSLSKDDLALLAEGSPDTLVGVKYGIGQRDLYCASDAQKLIQARLNEDGGDQYVREVFITWQECDKLKQAFHWPEHWTVAA